MDKNNGLNSLERDIVLQHLRENPVPITVSLEKKPDGMPALLFPVVIPVDKLQIGREGVVFVSGAARGIKPLLNCYVRVQFYFNHLGLYFIGRLCKHTHGYIIVVPPEVWKIADDRISQENAFTASIVYDARGSQKVTISCVPASGYDLLSPPQWKRIDPSFQSAAQELFERYVYELNVKENEDISYMIRVCRYLTQRFELAAVEGKALPLDIIYMDAWKVVLGSREQNPGLQLEADYDMIFEFPAADAESFSRIVCLSFTVSDVYIIEEKRIRCFVCSFNDVKKEDGRFLYEYFSGKKAV